MEPMQRFTYRQLNLAPYGVADLVQLGNENVDGELWVRVIECKRAVINATTYAQAARYQVAISRVLGCCHSEQVVYEKVLIGQRVDARNDFWALVAGDPFCTVYTYEYRATGIWFRRESSFSSFGHCDAGDMFRPSVDELIRAVGILQPNSQDGE